MLRNRNSRWLAGGVGAVLLSLWTGAAMADFRGPWTLNLPQGVTPISKQIYDLHMLILWICVIIGIVVFGAMFWSIFHHRKSKGAKAEQFHENTTVEVLWTVVPFMILVGMAIPATRTLIAMEDTSNPDVSIKVTGYQWRWHYDYLDEGFGFFSSLDAPANEARQLGSGIDPREVEHYLLDVDNPVVVPVNKKVRFLTTANDVIHSWWVPELGWKRDAIPGFINESWAMVTEPGTYRGACAELCGRDHAYMPVVLVALEQGEYEQWVEGQKQAQADATAAAAAAADREWTLDELMAEGQQVYNKACAACHQANGQGVPGVFPGLIGSPLIKGAVEEHIDIVVHGKAGTAMAAFGPQLNDAEIAAVVTYERNAWGNDSGDAVQPAAVAARR